MARTEAQKRATDKYLEGFDDIKVRVPKGKKDEYKDLARSEGKSLNTLIVELLENKLNERC